MHPKTIVSKFDWDVKKYCDSGYLCGEKLRQEDETALNSSFISDAKVDYRTLEKQYIEAHWEKKRWGRNYSSLIPSPIERTKPSPSKRDISKKERIMHNNLFTDRIAAIVKEQFCSDTYIQNPTGYFYDLQIILEKLQMLRDHKPDNITIFYAMKANDHPAVMHTVSNFSADIGVEIASSGELDIALTYVDSKKIIFTGPGKTEWELEKAVSSHIRYLNIESVTEAVRINAIAQKTGQSMVNVLLRINLNYSITDAEEQMSGNSTKMGIDEDEVLEIAQFIRGNCPYICIKGIHVFAACGVLDDELLISCNRYIFALTKKLEQVFPIEVIDLGGGLGIDYHDQGLSFDLSAYYSKLNALIGEFEFHGKEIIMELGTFLVGECGYYAAKIIDIKKVKGKKHIILAGGVNHSGLQLEMQRSQPVRIIPCKESPLSCKQTCVDDEIVDISGPLCMVSDKLSWNQYVTHAEIGDIAVFLMSGAYCYGEGMHQFLRHELPHFCIISEEGKKHE